MIYPATQEISNVFTLKGIKHRVDETGNLSFVEAGFTGDHVRGVIVRFISQDEKSDVAIRVTNFGAVSVDRAHTESVLEVLNEYNHKFRYVKFTLTDEGGINAEYDLAVRHSLDNVGNVCQEMFKRYTNILDEAYVPIMRAALL